MNIRTTSTNLVEVGQLGDLLPQAAHDVLVLGQLARIAVAATLDHARPHRHAVEVLLVQLAIVIDVCEREIES